MKTCTISILAALAVLSGAYVASSANQPRPMNQDLALQKHRIEEALGQQVISWLCDANDSAAVECDRLADLLLSLEEPDARSYFLAAQVANLREKPDKAIGILEQAISKYPNEPAPMQTVPVKIVGRFFIATIARYSGDIAKAKGVYETLLAMLGGPERIDSLGDKGGAMMICNLYLAEIESLHLKRNDLALVRLEAIGRIKKPPGQLGAGYDILKGWAAYEHTRISKGRVQATQQIVAPAEIMSGCLLAAAQLELCGLTDDPLGGCCGRDRRRKVINDTMIKRVVESGRSVIDRSLVRLGYGFDQQYKGKLAEAESHYSALLAEDSYFSPLGALYLAQCKKTQAKSAEADGILKEVRTKYPGYDAAVTKLKESWK